MGFLRRCVPCLLLIAAMSGCSSTSSQQKPLPVAELQEVSGNVPAGYIEIQGVSAGTFNPSYWQNDTLNWVPDVRAPLLPPQATGQVHAEDGVTPLANGSANVSAGKAYQ